MDCAPAKSAVSQPSQSQRVGIRRTTTLIAGQESPFDLKGLFPLCFWAAVRGGPRHKLRQQRVQVYYLSGANIATLALREAFTVQSKVAPALLHDTAAHAHRQTPPPSQATAEGEGSGRERPIPLACPVPRRIRFLPPNAGRQQSIRRRMAAAREAADPSDQCAAVRRCARTRL